MSSTIKDNDADNDDDQSPILHSDNLLILIVDDDKTNRLILSTLIKKLNHQVISAVNGEEAIKIFESDKPDIILMDVVMPIMDGYDAATEIKRLCNDIFVPIIFLTAITDENALAKCIEHGGDDFITKPYNSIIIKAKIDAMIRVSNLYNRISESKLEIQQHHNRLLREHEISKTIFTNITKPYNLNIDNIKYILKPVSITSGDILLCSRTPSGGMHVMLGDFTGHGLSAAIGAIPVSETFYNLSSTGYSIGDIVFNINKKLKETLPADFFCAACIIEADESFRSIAVWNGGIPDVVISSDDGPIKVPSSHLPLGILNSDEFDRSVFFTQLSHNNKIYLISDGVIEATNSNGEMYTQEKLESVLLESQSSNESFTNIKQSIESFCGDSIQRDDITLIEITSSPLDTLNNDSDVITSTATVIPAKWDLSIRLEAEALQHTNPCPLLIQSIMEIQGISSHRERIYTILSELFSNSLEHGLLNLDSSIKENPQGFLEYYNLREASLSTLADSYININIRHTPTETGGKLIIIVEDSGSGFDLSKHDANSPESINSYGRGINLVKSLCPILKYSNNGRKVEAEYVWFSL